MLFKIYQMNPSAMMVLWHHLNSFFLLLLLKLTICLQKQQLEQRSDDLIKHTLKAKKIHELSMLDGLI